MARRSQSYWAIAIGMIAWSLLLFSPLAFVSSVNAQEADHEYGTVIGIVSHYRRRGVELTRGCPAIAATFAATFAEARFSGFSGFCC